MATLSELRISISTIIQNLAYIDSMLTSRINEAVSSIAGGIRMPNGEISYPLPDLYSTGTVAIATDVAFKALPATYQRNVFFVIDGDGDELKPPKGGDYYSFKLFLNAITEKDLSESGSIIHVAVKGSKLYYQGIPTSSENLTVHFYKKPTVLVNDSDEPNAIPDHLQTNLIKHYVCADVFGENINNDKVAPGKAAYHKLEFYKSMQDLLDFIGEPDSEPVYYAGGVSGFQDLGVCD